jgi:hypothetical protein
VKARNFAESINIKINQGDCMPYTYLIGWSKLNKFYTEEFSWGKMLFNQDFPIILKKEE